MQNAEANNVDAPLGEAEYQTLEQTLMESERGRKFLGEYLLRHKTPETREILEAIQRLEKGMKRGDGKAPSMDAIRLDIAEMHDAIERTKKEIANIKTENDEPNRFVDASHELDAIVTQTEGATQTILESAEKIQEVAWNMREAGASDESCDEIDAMATEIFMACSFQDLTGQRTTKVVHVLRYLESRINTMINIWGLGDVEQEEMDAPVDVRPDAHLLNGPQLAGEGVSQDNVDDLFSGAPEEAEADVSADDMEFDKVETDASAEEMQEPMDADAIDAMFDAPEPEAEAEVAEEPAAEAEPVAEAAEDDLMIIGDAVDEVENAEDAIQFEEAEAVVSEAAEIVEEEAAAAEIDEEKIDQLFDAEMAEADADAEWEETEISAEDDPMNNMTEAERQALFN